MAPEPISPQVTQLLKKLQAGGREAMHDVVPVIYEELKKLARSHVRRERGAAFIQSTTLVHEAFLRMADGRHPAYENRAHFYGIASRLMRQILVDSARARAARKRGQDWKSRLQAFRIERLSPIEAYSLWMMRCSGSKRSTL